MVDKIKMLEKIMGLSKEHATPDRVAHSKSVLRLQEFASVLIGKECWKITFGYGGEFSLHCGGEVQITEGALKGEAEGEWIFNSFGSSWKLQASKLSISSGKLDEDRRERLLSQLAGRKIRTLRLDRAAMTIVFDGSIDLTISPSGEDIESGAPCWELLMPGNKTIECKCTGTWSLRSF